MPAPGKAPAPRLPRKSRVAKSAAKPSKRKAQAVPAAEEEAEEEEEEEDDEEGEEGDEEDDEDDPSFGTVRIGAVIEYCFDDHRPKREWEKNKVSPFYWPECVVIRPMAGKNGKQTASNKDWWRVMFFDKRGALTEPMNVLISKTNFNMERREPIGGWRFKSHKECLTMREAGGRCIAPKK